MDLKKFVKEWFAKRNLYLQKPVEIKSPLRRGKVSVFLSQDLEIDRARKLKEAQEADQLPHPVK